MTSHKAIVSGISGRYAVALFELALESKALEAVESDLSTL
ncbi:MAG: F0F1 ATP synthase subunit delta, partial [Alphaproteobacteria bacterium]|nr:F0F1 ATP synthase subunit delta [Alphaproteobacteria bacterium]